MFVASLTDAEVETLIIALRYWRRHRRSGRARKTDQVLPPSEVDALMTKLGTGIRDSLVAEEAMTELSSH